MIVKHHLIWVGLGLTALTMGAPAHANDGAVVYIECTGEGGKSTQGSGVVINEQGLFLTARHVVPDGYSCKASVGDNTLPLRKVRPNYRANNIAAGFDVTVMEFGSNESFTTADICALNPTHKGKDIIAKGFHADDFGNPSETEGVLSIAKPDPFGMIETTAMTVNGKSGGPVFLKDTDKVVGIVAGAEFTPQGIVSSYKMLAVNAFIKDLGLLSDPQACAKDLRITPVLESPIALPGTQMAATIPDPKTDPPKPDRPTPRPTFTTKHLQDPNFPDHITGLNVSYIDFPNGHFKQVGPGSWVLHDDWHNVMATYTELGRDEESLVLVNDFNGITVTFDGVQRLITTSDEYGQPYLQPITKVE